MPKQARIKKKIVAASEAHFSWDFVLDGTGSATLLKGTTMPSRPPRLSLSPFSHSLFGLQLMDCCVLPAVNLTSPSAHLSILNDLTYSLTCINPFSTTL